MGKVDTSLMTPELAFMDVQATDAAGLFAALEPVMLERGLVRKTWLGAITARERAYPTGLAFEDICVAIPHVESEHISRPYIALVRPRTSVCFCGMGGMDPVDAQLVVNLGLVAHDDDQLDTLQALMGVFACHEAVADIMAQDSPEGLVQAMARWCEGCAGQA